jgi:hypothetical protein
MRVGCRAACPWRALILTLTMGQACACGAEDGLSRLYHVHEFAGLPGVTVKTLHHYDRIGLLTPTRTEAGYRLYVEADLERLEQIIALKFLGFSLRQVQDILEQTSVELADALRWQR